MLKEQAVRIGVRVQFRENGSRHLGLREHNNTLTLISLSNFSLSSPCFAASGYAQPPCLLRRLERLGADVPDRAVRDSSHFLNEA